MRATLLLIVLAANMTFVEVVHSQTVPSAVSIVPTNTTTPEDADSSMYEKRPIAKTPRRAPVELPKSNEPKQASPDPQVSRPMDQATSMIDAAPSKERDNEEFGERTVGEQFSDIIVGGSGDEIYRYRSLLGPDDIRRNQVELEVGPMFIYNDSRSDYYYRNYITATPGGRVGVNVWFTPFFGIAANYERTFIGTMKKDMTGASQTPFQDQWLQIGFKFRRYTSFSLLSSSLTFSLDYLDYQKKVPTDDVNRTKLATSGLLIGLEARNPTSENTAWLFKMDYMAIANHREVPTVGNIKSGERVQTFRMGLSIGQEFKLNRQNRLTFKVRDVYEKNSFTGFANKTDPRTGDLPENVSVNNNTIFLEIGYIWGH